MSEVKTIFHGVHDGKAVWERWQHAEPAVDFAKLADPDNRKFVVKY